MQNRGSYYRGSKDSIEFRQIVLQHIQKILEISSRELRDRSRIIQHERYAEGVEEEDTRYSYIQAIENFAYILLPYFDKEMKEIYKKCIKVISGFGFEVLEVLKEEFKEVELDGDTKKEDAFILEMRIRYSKDLFCNLNLLLKRQDYLQKAIFGEEMGDETVIVEGDEDEEE